MKNPSWDRLRILKAVIETGSFSKAARLFGTSQPTISRQVKALELDLQELLVQVTPDGVHATEAGLALMPIVEEMTRAANQIDTRKKEPHSIPVVRIACGPWIARFLSQNTNRLLGEPVERHIEIVSSIMFSDIPRREADIAIRSKRPDSGPVRVRRLPHYTYAVYGKTEMVADREAAFDNRRFNEFRWAMLAPELDHFATSSWLKDQGVTSPVFRCSASVNLLDALLGGDLLAVIPCFVGDAECALARVSDPFVPTSGEIWMVLAEDAGRRPSIRQTADTLWELFCDKFKPEHA